MNKREVIDLLGDDDDNEPARRRPRPLPEASRPVCPYGDMCYRKNPRHWEKYLHPASKAGRAAERRIGKEVITLSDGDDDAAPRPPAAASSSAATSSSATASSSAARSSAAAYSSAAASPAPAPWERPAGEITCPICFCETAPAEAAALVACGCAFCEDCITAYVKSKLEAGEVMPDQLACPCVEPKKCGVPLVPQDVKRALGAACDGERYERLALQRCVEAEDDLGCCPSAGCGFMFAWEADNRKLDCPLCKKSFCLMCRTEPWHQGTRCEQFQAERGDPEASDAAFATFAKSQRLRQCPKCRFWVEKQGGCDAMHCRCNLVFCYTCGGVLKKTSKATGIKECSCGATNEQLLRAHDGAPNHNLVARGGGGGGDGGGGGGGGGHENHNAFLRRMAALGHHVDEDDYDDDDDGDGDY